MGKNLLLWVVIGMVFMSVFNMFGEGKLDKPVSIPKPVMKASSAFQEEIDLSLSVANDGHYYVQGEGNGFPVVFIVDTGATFLTMPMDYLRNMNIKRCVKVISNTANGSVEGCKAVLNKVIVGPYEINNVQTVFLPKLKRPLLGMNVLRLFSMSNFGGSLQIAPR